MYSFRSEIIILSMVRIPESFDIIYPDFGPEVLLLLHIYIVL